MNHPDREREPRGGPRRGRRRLLVALGVLVLLAALYVPLSSGLGLLMTGLFMDGAELDFPEERGTLAFAAGAPELPFDVENLQLPAERFVFGGVRKDGIPALTDPGTIPAAEAESAGLAPGDRVIGLELDGEARAYPIRILNWHEIVNDTLGGTKVGVIYCPLCDSLSVVNRKRQGRVHEFGVSGMVYNSNLVMYDRTDDSLWSQLAMKAVSGPNAGAELEHLEGWELTTFGAWRARHPETTVLSFDTGFPRAYEQPGYGGYHENDSLVFTVEPSSDRFHRKTPLIGIVYGDLARAYLIETILERPETLEAGVLRDPVGGGMLELRPDPETRTVRVVSAPDGARVVHSYWFAWYAFHPETQVWGEDEREPDG